MIHKVKNAWRNLRTQVNAVQLQISQVEHQSARQYDALIEKTEAITRDVQRVTSLIQEYKDAHDLRPCGETFRGHDKKRKQVLVVGWYGAENYGDELMLDTLYRELNLDSNVEISILLAKNDEYNRDQWDGAHLFYFPESEAHLDAIAGFYDEVILGGGAHVDDKDVPELSFVPYVARRISLLMIERQKSVKWIAVSSSKTLKNKKYVEDLEKIIDGATVFSLRDKNSLTTLRKAGIKNKNITIVDDIAFTPKLDKKILGITLIDYFNDRDTLVKFCNDIVSFAEQDPEEWKICFLPFYNESGVDKQLYEDIIGRVDWRNIEVFVAPTYENINGMLLMMKACDAFVNMRYHATLLSLRMATPTVSICYDAHPHYYNKITYIHEIYNSKDIAYFSQYQKGDIAKMLTRARSNKLNVIDTEIQKRAAKELHTAVSRL